MGNLKSSRYDGIFDAIMRAMALLTAAAFLFVSTLIPAEAADLSWAPFSRGAASPFLAGIAPPGAQPMKGNIVYVNNRFSAAILRIPAAELSNTVVQNLVNQAEVFAVYDPDTFTGYIYAVRTVRRGGSIYVQEARVSPANGTIFARDFEGKNPWWQFSAPAGTTDYGAFYDIQPNAFLTAVGLTMQHIWAAHALIATLNANPVKTVHTSGFFIKTTTTTLKTTDSPVWTLAVPFGAAIGQTTGYTLPVQPALSGLTGAATASVFRGVHTLGGGATVWRDPSTGHFSNTQGGGYTQAWAGLRVPAGVTFVAEGAGNTMPAGNWLAFQHVKSVSGFGFILEIIIAAALTAVTWGAATEALPALMTEVNIELAGALTTLGIPVTTATMATAAATVGAAGSLGWSAAGGGSLGGPASSTSPLPGFGGASGAPAYTAYAVNIANYLKSLGTANYPAGDSAASNAMAPTTQASVWDWRPGTFTSVSPSPASNPFVPPANNAQSMPSSVGAVNATETYAPGDARVSQPLGMQKSQMPLTGGSPGYPVLDTGNNPYGSLPPLP
ncbi:MAG: hypothetical protein B7Z66_12305 [Chromatiales bacterium 21-64-14]|nr:MAG: hypothetical protein B7Z66_12305 [Chromatiales bacterium 21-64-14]HQU15502.1 hypothetical protein [Gammaproteobacteria bacterium]